MCTTDDGTSLLTSGDSVRLKCKAQGDKISIDQKKNDLGLPFCEFSVYNMPRLKLGTDITAVYTSVSKSDVLVALSDTSVIANVMKSVIDLEYSITSSEQVYVVFELDSHKDVDKISIVCPTPQDNTTPNCDDIKIILLSAT